MRPTIMENIRGMALLVVAAALTITSCTGAARPHAAPAGARTGPLPTHAGTSSIVVLVSSRAYGVATAPASVPARRAVTLAPNRVAFNWPGSGTCPPAVTSATITGDTLLMPVGPAHTMCTLDLRRYVVVVTLSAAILGPNANKSITSITVEYVGGKLRLPLVSA